MVFDLEGGTLPSAYPFALWDALLHHAPQLASEKLVGVLPLRATESKEGILITKRTKLVLRLPKVLADPIAKCLVGSTLQIGTNPLSVGHCKSRDILPFPTVHGQLVKGADNEVLFIDDVKNQLNEMGITAKLICGKRHAINGDQQSIQGYSLVVHDLKPEASLQLQYAGLGEDRQLGCGIFIPYKVISGLSDD